MLDPSLGNGVERVEQTPWMGVDRLAIGRVDAPNDRHLLDKIPQLGPTLSCIKPSPFAKEVNPVLRAGDGDGAEEEPVVVCKGELADGVRDEQNRVRVAEGGVVRERRERRTSVECVLEDALDHLDRKGCEKGRAERVGSATDEAWQGRQALRAHTLTGHSLSSPHDGQGAG